MRRRFVFNSPRMLARRKQLRNNPTEAELLLWNELRKSKLGLKFIRQYSIEGYILDFYCPSRRLGIEIDGSSHTKENQKIYDNYRSRYLKAFGIKILRFWNKKVLDDINGVLKRINSPS